MTKLFLPTVLVLALCTGLPAEQQPQQKTNLVFPEYYSDFLLQNQFSLRIDTTTQEQIEVSAPEYPGLEIELPPLKERLEVPKPQFLKPTRSPEYYQGGQILSHWGFPMESGQLLSMPVIEE